MINPKNSMVTLAFACAVMAVGCGPRSGNAPSSSAPAGPLRTKITTALPDNGFKATVTPSNPPATMKAGEQQTVTVHVKNASDVTWPADSDGKVTITLRNRWLSADGNKVVNDVDGGTPMVYDLPAGGEVDLQLKVTAPKEKGNYTLEFDMVQEQVAFFREKGSTPARINLKVE